MVPHRSKMSYHETAPILDDIYEHTIPESEGQIEEAEDEIVLQPQQQQQHSQRRMGYLDLHPRVPTTTPKPIRRRRPSRARHPRSR